MFLTANSFFSAFSKNSDQKDIFEYIVFKAESKPKQNVNVVYNVSYIYVYISCLDGPSIMFSVRLKDTYMQHTGGPYFREQLT